MPSLARVLTGYAVVRSPGGRYHVHEMCGNQVCGRVNRRVGAKGHIFKFMAESEMHALVRERRNRREPEVVSTAAL